jgi:hypothetical protein
MLIKAWINFIIGAWLILCGFTPSIQTPSNMFIAGILAVIFGFWLTGTEVGWPGTVTGILGIWLFLSGLWFGFNQPWNFFISGIIIAVLAVWSVVKYPERKEKPRGFLLEYAPVFFLLFIAFGWLVAWIIYILFAAIFL